ncbi:MAG: hypothetical protein WCB76_19095, partial [Acidobacteriaceae bacterium]
MTALLWGLAGVPSCRGFASLNHNESCALHAFPILPIVCLILSGVAVGLVRQGLGDGFAIF